MVFSNTVYDKLKWIGRYLLPGLTTLWLAVSKAWGLPYTTEIGATLGALTVFLNTILGVSNHNYDGEGEIIVNDDGTISNFKIQNGRTVQDLVEQKNVTIKVNKG